MTQMTSWGFYPEAPKQTLQWLQNRMTDLSSVINSAPTSSFLPRGLGRSYGDSCLNDHGVLLSTQNLNHFISFEPHSGILTCEAGVSFDEILRLIVPRGWFLPVTPGTKFVTVAGAIANDVHGKNHHQAGNFGHHVLRFEILRSSGERLICSRNENSELFFATLGGLGLTGFITWAEIKLTSIQSAWVNQQKIQFHSLKDFFYLSEESENTHEFTVSWVDCVNSTQDIRGIFIRGNWASTIPEKNLQLHKTDTFKNIPMFFPDWVLNKLSIRAFNEVYFHKNLVANKSDLIHYEPFYYPLDSIRHWNKIYGQRGFLQYQCVVPYKNDGGAALAEIFSILQRSQMGSFLAVLKTFGTKESEGLLSFPREGVTLALDFPNHGEALLQVLEQCDSVVKAAGGAVYPAKDARMSPESFAAFFPRLPEFEKHIDPRFSSSFWRRTR